MVLDPIRWLMSAVFGTKWVVLTDWDGSECIRLARTHKSAWVAERMGGIIGRGIRRVELLPNGELGSGRYVESWRPYAPFEDLRSQPKPPFPAYTGATH